MTAHATIDLTRHQRHATTHRLYHLLVLVQHLEEYVLARRNHKARRAILLDRHITQNLLVLKAVPVECRGLLALTRPTAVSPASLFGRFDDTQPLRLAILYASHMSALIDILNIELTLVACEVTHRRQCNWLLWCLHNVWVEYASCTLNQQLLRAIHSHQIDALLVAAALLLPVGVGI